jgi:hypothetical protein
MRQNDPQDNGNELFFGTGWIFLTLLLIALFGVGIWKWAPESESLRAWGEYFTGAGTVGLVAGALYAAAVAVREYRRGLRGDHERTKLEKAKWLSELFVSFYEKEKYKEIRRMIDFGEIDEILRLIREDLKPNPKFSKEDQELFDGFTDYMNLFEFVAYLNRLNQLDGEDIKAMFAYYLQRLVNVDESGEIRNYLRSNGYGNLIHLLEGYES